VGNYPTIARGGRGGGRKNNRGARKGGAVIVPARKEGKPTGPIAGTVAFALKSGDGRRGVLHQQLDTTG